MGSCFCSDYICGQDLQDCFIRWKAYTISGCFNRCKYLSSHVGIESQVIFDDNDPIFSGNSDRITTSNTFDSFTVSYGIGVGINIHIFEGSLDFQNPISKISLHLGGQCG